MKVIVTFETNDDDKMLKLGKEFSEHVCAFKKDGVKFVVGGVKFEREEHGVKTVVTKEVVKNGKADK
jgi:hypothetical protein